MLQQKIYWCLFFISLFGFGQEKVILSGVVSDTKNNETLIGVSVYISELNIGTYTNEYGFYSISVPKGNYTVQVSYVGFKTITEKIESNQNVKKNFSLMESNLELKEVVITKNIYRTNIKKPEMSVNKLSINTIKQMPAILGETDVIKSILYLNHLESFKSFT